MKFSEQRRSLLSSQARIQIPWIKVTIGDYTFGVFSGELSKQKGAWSYYNIQYPNYIQSLTVTKINGQVNQYVLTIAYPITQNDDPNFFEKVFSSVSGSRSIIFSYGDASQPAYIYKDEKAIITSIQQSFQLASSVINYTINAVSGAALMTDGCLTFQATGREVKPSTEIKNLFRSNTSLQNMFTGMNSKNLDELIAGDDKPVKLDTKRNISALDYISYLVSCMIPSGSTAAQPKDIYILTIHDDTIYDSYADDYSKNGPYFKVTKTSYVSEHSDAYEVDIGYNTSTLVSEFSIDQNENYALYYDYQKKLQPREYIKRLNEMGEWEEVYAPTVTSMTSEKSFETDPDDITWWTKITKYPIQASITIQGLLRPAMLMNYLRLNVIFPGGHKHIASGLYIITKQVDKIDANGYKTTLNLTKISGDTQIATNPGSLKANKNVSSLGTTGRL